MGSVTSTLQKKESTTYSKRANVKFIADRFGSTTTSQKEQSSKRPDIFRPHIDYDKEYHSTEIVAAYIRNIASKDGIIPLEIIQICQQYVPLRELIIEENETVQLSSGIIHEYDRIIINEFGRLTTTGWNGEEGGKLLIKSKYIEIKPQGQIDVNGKGYRGGNMGYQGESYYGMGQQKIGANNDGGGGCYDREHDPDDTWKGCGGGYGTKGGGKYGGAIYGDDDLTTMYLGSGGGGDPYNWSSGSNGGGILFIIAERLVIKTYGRIQSNGDEANGRGGAGSGGSLYIKCKEIINDGYIEAKGGYGGGWIEEKGWFGGHGRIRIDCPGFDNKEQYIYGEEAQPY